MSNIGKKLFTHLDISLCTLDDESIVNTLRSSHPKITFVRGDKPIDYIIDLIEEEEENRCLVSLRMKAYEYWPNESSILEEFKNFITKENPVWKLLPPILQEQHEKHLTLTGFETDSNFYIPGNSKNAKEILKEVGFVTVLVSLSNEEQIDDEYDIGLCCVCSEPLEQIELECEVCEETVAHFECAGVPEETTSWFCPSCADSTQAKKKKMKITNDDDIIDDKEEKDQKESKEEEKEEKEGKEEV